jgi:4-hydroxy-2-oxoheptanedioate aldolase
VRAEHPDHGGLHGVGLRRDVRTVLHGGSDGWIAALAGSVVAIMVEKRQALEDLDSILEVGGIDMVQFGPADYSMSMGLSRSRDRDRIREAEEHTIATALRHGVAPRAEIRDATGAAYYLDLGVKHFCVGHDVRILHDWFSVQGVEMRRALSGLSADGAPAAPSMPRVTSEVAAPAPRGARA